MCLCICLSTPKSPHKRFNVLSSKRENNEHLTVSGKSTPPCRWPAGLPEGTGLALQCAAREAPIWCRAVAVTAVIVADVCLKCLNCCHLPVLMNKVRKMKTFTVHLGLKPCHKLPPNLPARGGIYPPLLTIQHLHSLPSLPKIRKPLWP